MKNYYDIPGVSDNSTQDESKERFRFLAQAFHPDKPGSQSQKNRAVGIFFILALLALMIIAGLSFINRGPILRNIRVAKDQKGTQPSSVFATTDTIYVVSDLSKGVAGNVVSSKWYAVEVAGTEPNLLLDEAVISIDEDKDYSLYFYFPPPLDGQWPVGSYKVEVYFNGVLNSTVDFTVQ